MARIYGKEAEGSGFVGAAWKLRLWYEITSPSETSTQISYGLEIYNTTGSAYNNYSPPNSSAPYYKLGEGKASSLEKIYFTYNYDNTAAWRTLGTKTITITDPSIREVTISGAWHSVKTDWTPGDIETTLTIGDSALPLLKTACTAPTSITVQGLTTKSTTAIVPSETIRISWSGAQGGVNNSITGYDVYISCTSDGAVPEESGTGVFYKSVKETSLEITSATLSDTKTTLTLTRGYKIRVKVRTKGDNSEYYSDFKTSSAILVNQLPSPPTATSKTVLSTVTSTTIAVAAGAMNTGFSRSAKNIYYSTSSAGSKSLYSSTLSFTLSTTKNTTDFFFWTFDGQEYSSSYTKVTITKNIAPNISTSSFSGTKCTVYGFPADKVSIDTFNGSIVFNKEGLTCKPFIKYGDLTYSSIEDSLPNIVNVPFGALSKNTFSFNEIDPRTYIPFGSTFTVGVVATDSMGESCSCEFKSLSGEETLSLSVADFPQFISANNGANESNHFYNQVIFEYTYDSYFSNVKNYFNCSVSNAIIKNVSAVETVATKFKITVDVSGNLIPGAQYTFKCSLSKKNKTSTVTSSQFTQCYILDGTTKNAIYLRPFTDGSNGVTKTFDISLANGAVKTTLTEFFKYYDIDSNDWLETYVVYNGKEERIGTENFTFNYSVEEDYFKINVSFTGSSLYDLLEKFAFPNKNSRYTLSIRNKIKNIFNREDTYDAAVLTVDYNEVPNGGLSISGAPEVKILYNGNVYSYPTDVPITEGLEIVFFPKVTTYNFSNYTYAIQKSTDKTIWEDYIIENNVGSFNNNAGFGAPETIEFAKDKLKIVIGEISDNRDVYFRVGIKFEGYDMELSEPTAAFKRLKHTKTPIALNEANYSDGKLTIKYQYDTLGFNSIGFVQTESKVECVVKLGNAENLVSLLNGSYTAWEDKIGKLQEVSPEFSMGDETYGFLRLKLTSVSSVTYDFGGGVVLEKRIEKIYETNTTTIYNSAQTISYRQNHIGINTGNFGTNDVLKISATASRYLAVFESSNNKIYLNLQNGQLAGIVIDCGEITS